MFYEGNRLLNLKKQLDIALHNASEIAKGVYPTPEQFICRCEFSFVKNIAAKQLIHLCDNDAEQLISDLNEYSKEAIMPLILCYVQEHAIFACPETIYKDLKQAALPITAE